MNIHKIALQSQSYFSTKWTCQFRDLQPGADAGYMQGRDRTALGQVANGGLTLGALIGILPSKDLEH